MRIGNILYMLVFGLVLFVSACSGDGSNGATDGDINSDGDNAADGDGVSDSDDVSDGDGAPDGDGESGSCPGDAPQADNQLGVCRGALKVCDDELGWVNDYAAHSANYQEEETLCDGLDNDCDDETDEGWNVGSVCTVGIGACAAEGDIECDSDGNGSHCAGEAITPITETDETCDGQDDDCDGQTDEDYEPMVDCGSGTCQTGTAPSTCDNGLERPCTPIYAEIGTACGNDDRNQCDGAGNCVDCVNADGCTELLKGDRSPDCLEIVCNSSHNCGFQGRPSGTACGANNLDQCDGSGECVDCMDVNGCDDWPDDGNPCTSTVCSGYNCEDDYDDDNNCDLRYACTTDHCVSGTCMIDTIDSGCLISGVCVDEGQSQDSDGCVACDPNVSRTNWTDMNGAACAVTDDGNPCTDEVCRSGTCESEDNDDNTCSAAYSCTDTVCSDGSCVLDTVNTGCFIENACYANEDNQGTTGDAQCKACLTATSQTGWTPRNSGSCDDANDCTYDDVCSSGQCDGTPYTCDAEHGVCNGDGSCACDHENMNDDCSEIGRAHV